MEPKLEPKATLKMLREMYLWLKQSYRQNMLDSKGEELSLDWLMLVAEEGKKNGKNRRK